MTPAAQVAAAIELLAAIAADGRPADAVAGYYFKTRRYIGSKDRRTISIRVWGALRRRARLGWWLNEIGVEDFPRERVLADLVLTEHLDEPAIKALFSGEKNAPEKLTAEDRKLIEQLKAKDLFNHAMPAWVRAEFPEWIEPRLTELFGEELAREDRKSVV